MRFSRKFNLADCRFFCVSRKQIFANLEFRLYHREQVFVDFLKVALWYLTYETCIEQQGM